jgi:hypothetical protein
MSPRCHRPNYRNNYHTIVDVAIVVAVAYHNREAKPMIPSDGYTSMKDVVVVRNKVTCDL